ncbi:MAG: pyruvate dehydrogenase (acetyl-transferring) E1 component subunit alpha [Parachlamydia sp.]|nr:pyruvate dehydrogenase (acetyl-transferring) E1 component subunit alpha [Parachlamydia sp.]
MSPSDDPHYTFFPFGQKEIFAKIGKARLMEALRRMLLIRNFEVRAESAYLQGKVGGFFHSYIGQEAIQTAAVSVMGLENWWITSYRCHALALLLGATPKELMAELYGRETGNARGRGGSMHFYTERLLGGFGIVGGQVPIATGAAFTIKYLGKKDEVAVCFLGDGAVVQGAFHEALNLAALWDLPCIYVIENNKWGMGTSVERAVSVPRLAEDKAPGYNMKGYTFDGMDYFSCYAGFEHVYRETLETSRPVLIEVVTERFKGHSISDPGLYRSKEELKARMQRDPILIFKQALIEAKVLDDETYNQIDKEYRDQMIEAMKAADSDPWPDPIHLEEDVYAP